MLFRSKASKVDYDHEKYKVWPTNRDRAAFKAVHEAGAVEKNLDQHLTREHLFTDGLSEHTASKLADGYLYFFNQIRRWLLGELDDADEQNTEIKTEDRLEALWKVISAGLQVVVINLDDDDESQVIFETLNARGTQLLPADLVKNYLFRKAQTEEQDIDSLYQRY